MGRPVNSRYFGDPSGGTQIRVECNTGNGPTDTGYIISQRSTNQFRVTDGTTPLQCKLVDKLATDLAEGEMVAFGQLSGTGQRVTLQKLFNRTVVDWEGNRYDWEIQDDSTETVMVLTQI
jgi:hypothetical protein